MTEYAVVPPRLKTLFTQMKPAVVLYTSLAPLSVMSSEPVPVIGLGVIVNVTPPSGAMPPVTAWFFASFLMTSEPFLLVNDAFAVSFARSRAAHVLAVLTVTDCEPLWPK